MNDLVEPAALIFVTLFLIETIRSSLTLVKNLRSEPKLPPAPSRLSEEPLPLVSVVIPARNEERFIEQCLIAVLASDYPHLEAIVVDDRSEDRTPAIIARLERSEERVRALSTDRLPDGWTGKTYALKRGADEARGSVLLFIDADSLLSENGISRAVDYLLSENTDMLSLVPGFLNPGFIEKAVYPHFMLGLSYLYPLAEINSPSSSSALAMGAFIMIRRRTYEAAGTWAAVRTEVTEDVAMSRRVKAMGARLKLVRGDEVIRTARVGRVGDLVRMWKRIFYGALERSPRKTALLAGLYASLTAAPLVWIWSIVATAPGGASVLMTLTAIVSTIGVLLFAGVFGEFFRERTGSRLYVLFSPIATGTACWTALATFRATVAGSGVAWRGRVYR